VLIILVLLVIAWRRCGGCVCAGTLGTRGLGARSREVVVAVAEQPGPAGDVALAASGYIVPRRRVEVSSKISGRVEELLVDRGDVVKVGQILARLDDREIRAQLEQARAAGRPPWRVWKRRLPVHGRRRSSVPRRRWRRRRRI